MHRQFAGDVAGGGGFQRKIGQEGADRRLSLAVIGLAHDLFRPRLGQISGKAVAASRVIGQPGQQFGQLAHVGLAVIGPDAHAVQLQKLAREVFVQPAATPFDLGRVRPGRAGLVQIKQHARVMHHSGQHVAKAARKVGGAARLRQSQ